jgi:Transposase DDE domain
VYLRETKRRNKDGSTVSYLQLAHNERHAETGSPVAKVIHNFGRADQVDREGLARLVSSISRFLEPAEAVRATSGSEVAVVDARRFGGAYVLRQLFERLGIADALVQSADGRRLEAGLVEQVLFALVANRCLEPGSKLAATHWAAERVALLGCPSFDDDAAYAAMDFLLDALPEIAKGIFDRTATLLNLSCDVIFVDTSSTYFERDVPDPLIELDTAAGIREARQEAKEDHGPDEGAVRRFSKHSKDHRPDLPQVVLGMAVTAEGIPIRCWTFPGTTSDQAIMKTIKDDLAGWMLNRVVWVADSGFNSANNRAYLQRGGGHYIVAERVRGGSKEAKAALARAGRYHLVAGNLEVKEVRLGDGARSQRFCVCHNPEVAARDRRVRENLVHYLEGRIEGSDTWTKQRRDELVGELRTTPALHRLVRRTPDGALRVDKGAIANEERSDGKFLLRTSDDTLSTTDLALAYKQLYEVERGWRDLKGSLRLRPVFHHREDRIRSHVQLCWLALLLVRTIEHETGDTWRNVRNELDRMHLVTLETPDGRVAQRSTTTPGQHQIFRALDIAEPARFYDFELPGPAA